MACVPVRVPWDSVSVLCDSVLVPLLVSVAPLSVLVAPLWVTVSPLFVKVSPVLVRPVSVGVSVPVRGGSGSGESDTDGVAGMVTLVAEKWLFCTSHAVVPAVISHSSAMVVPSLSRSVTRAPTFLAVFCPHHTMESRQYSWPRSTRTQAEVEDVV